ncbi:MAG: FHA domain-containing protein [Alistipes sp.]|nr:FHA domain-containing protein [Alistipes sp.]
MSEKTVYPGAPVNNVDYSQSSNPSQGFTPVNNDGTIFPGAVPAASNSASVNKKPIYGFLYSVSKDSCGEYWPLYLGANTIGRSANANVCLSEASVSSQHATLVIRQMQNKGEDAGLFVFIQDTGSMCGTLVNGTTLDFNPRECKNGDIITIGENYELYFILVEPKAIGLLPKPNFKSTAKAEPVPVAPGHNIFSGNVNKGTIAGDGSSSLENKMATMYGPK